MTRGSDIVGNLDGVCAFWSEPGEPSRLSENSPVPVLLLSGRFDPVTPPGYARIATEAIGATARLVEMQHSGHGAQRNMCVGLRMIPTFFEDPEAELVDCSTGETPHRLHDATRGLSGWRPGPTCGARGWRLHGGRRPCGKPIVGTSQHCARCQHHNEGEHRPCLD